jgi:predicted dehydrogenase
MKRDEFLKLSGAAAAFLGLGSATTLRAAELNEYLLKGEKRATGSAVGLKTEPIKKVRVGIIGMGNRGSGLLEMFDWLISEGHCEVVGLADKVEKKAMKGAEYLRTRQKSKPTLYTKGEDDWKNLARRKDVDLLIICTPWSMHTSMCLFALQYGKHVATEVPAARTLEECWQLIEAAEKAGRHCIMLENCCYNDEEMFVLNMVQDGVFGELTHAECAYLHDLRVMLLDDKYYEDQWRIKEHVSRNGNLYPTHGLGPVSMYMDIGRGDTFDHLVSMSSKEAGLSLAAKNANSPFNTFACGDVSTTLIKTAKGRSIMVQFDVHTGRPYSRINMLCGTKAVHEGYPSRMYLDQGPSWSHQWLDDAEYKELREKYQHPLWKRLKTQVSEKSMGHGGMDFVMIYRLIRCINEGLPLDINLYDGVMWSAVSPLSEISASANSASVPFPDFTGGTWAKGRSIEVMRSML